MNWFTLAFISAVFSAASAISEKKALFSLSSINFSFIVSVITLFFSIPFFISIDYSIISITNILILFFKTLLGCAAFFCVMQSIKNLEISEALPLLALTPGLVAICGFFFINDHLKIIEWIGIILMMVGTYLLELKKSNNNFFTAFKSLFHLSKYSYVLIALILFTITSLIDRFLLKDYRLPPYTFMAFQQLFYAIIFTIVILSKNKNIILPFKQIQSDVIIWILLVAIFTVIYRYTQIEATKLAPVALVISVKRLSVLMAILLGGRLFKEESLFRKAIATIIILIGATMLMNGE